MGGSTPTIWERLFDKGLGVFDRLADFELAKMELELANMYRALGFQAQQQAAPTSTGVGSGGLGLAGFPWATVLTVGLIGGGAYVLLKKL